MLGGEGGYQYQYQYQYKYKYKYQYQSINNYFFNS